MQASCRFSLSNVSPARSTSTGLRAPRLAYVPFVHHIRHIRSGSSRTGFKKILAWQFLFLLSYCTYISSPPIRSACDEHSVLMSSSYLIQQLLEKVSKRVLQLDTLANWKSCWTSAEMEIQISGDMAIGIRSTPLSSETSTIRYMALLDANSKIIEPTFLIDDATENQLVEQVLNMFSDNNSEVKSVAAKT